MFIHDIPTNWNSFSCNKDFNSEVWIELNNFYQKNKMCQDYWKYFFYIKNTLHTKYILITLMFRECRLSIFANSESALQLFQPPTGCALFVRHDLPDYHASGSLEKSRTWDHHSYNNHTFFSISSKCDYDDGFNLYDFGDWTGKVGTQHHPKIIP